MNLTTKEQRNKGLQPLWLAWFSLFLCCSTHAAEWKYIGGEVETNGWVYRLTLSTSPDQGSAAAVTNLQFFNGFLTNNTPSTTNMLTLTVISPGFDDAAVSNRLTRTVYGTRLLRLPFPMQNTNDVIAENTTNVVVRIALSEFVMSNDVVTATGRAGAVASTNLSAFTNSAAFTAQSVTNGSVQPWSAAKAIANWSYPGFRIITNDTIDLRVVGFHRTGQSGRPLRCVKFIVQDASGNSATNIQTHMQIDWSMGDANPIPEYIARVNVSTFTNGDQLTCHFEAIPWGGDTASIQTTTDGVNVRGPNYAPQYNRLDRLNNWGLSWCHVDPTNGTTAGIVSSNATFSGLAAFDSIGHALDACALSNAIWYGGTVRSNTSNSRLFLAPGKYDVMTHATTKGNPFSNPAPLIQSHPTNATREMAWIHRPGTYSYVHNKRFHFYNLQLGFTNSFGFDDGIDHMTIERCTLDSTVVMFSAITNCYTMRSSISNAGFTASGFAPTLIRGNWFYNTNQCRMRTYTQIGNRRMVPMSGPISVPIVATVFAGASPYPDRPICAYNSWLGLWCDSANAVEFFDTINCTNGGALVQNVIEQRIKTAQNYTFTMGAGVGSTNLTNIIVWGNNFLGGRIFFGYNDTGDAPWYRYLFSVKNNTFDQYNCKTDTFTTGNAARNGNWPLSFGVGYFGNICPYTTNNTTTPAIYNDHFGLSGYQGDVAQIERGYPNWFAWTDSQASADVTKAGMGNYRPLSYSTNFTITADWVLPFDLEGNPRGVIDPPGAYSAGNVRKGAFF